MQKLELHIREREREREREVKSISMAERETSGPTTALDCVQLQRERERK